MTEGPAETRYELPPAAGPAAAPVATWAPAAGEVAPVAFAAVPKLSAALAAARDRCRGARKDRTNAYHDYAYSSADAVLAAAHAALDGSGLALVPVRQALTVAGAGGAALYALDRVFVLSHASGEWCRLDLDGWPVVPDKGRPMDKAFAIALTTSLAYMVTQLLQMNRDAEDPAVAAYFDRVAAADSVDALRAVYDAVRADAAIGKADRRRIQAAIADRKKILAGPPPAAT